MCSWHSMCHLWLRQMSCASWEILFWESAGVNVGAPRVTSAKVHNSSVRICTPINDPPARSSLSQPKNSLELSENSILAKIFIIIANVPSVDLQTQVCLSLSISTTPLKSPSSCRGIAVGGSFAGTSMHQILLTRTLLLQREK